MSAGYGLMPPPPLDSSALPRVAPAVRTLTLDKPVSPEVTIVVPGRSYAELMRVLPDAEAPIEITVTPNKSQVLFHVEGIDLVSRLIEGQFPNYEPVIPTGHTSRAVIDRESFLAGTRRASIFARDSANIVKIELGGDNFSQLSALHGFIMVTRSEHRPWDEGPTLLHVLENLHEPHSVSSLARRAVVRVH